MNSNVNMNKTRQVKLLAAIFIMAMAVCACAVLVPADESSAAATSMPAPVGGVVTLTDDVNLSSQYTVPAEVTKIDLGGHTITVADNLKNAILVPSGVKVTIDNGTITEYFTKQSLSTIAVLGEATFGSNLEVVTKGVYDSSYFCGPMAIFGGTVTVNGTVFDGNLSGIALYNSTYYTSKEGSHNTNDAVSSTLVFNSGSITAALYLISGNNQHSGGSVIDINGGTFSVTEDSKETAIYIPMESKITIDNASIYGGIVMRMGSLTITDSIVTESREFTEVLDFANNSGCALTGNAITLVAQNYGNSKDQYKSTPNLTLNIGTGTILTSEQGYSVDILNTRQVTEKTQDATVNIQVPVDSVRIFDQGKGTSESPVSVILDDVSELKTTAYADLTINGDVTIVGESKIVKTLTVNEKASMTLGTGASLAVGTGATATNMGTIDTTAGTLEGTVTNIGGTTEVGVPETITNQAITDAFKQGATVIELNGTVTEDITVPAGKTVVVTDDTVFQNTTSNTPAVIIIGGDSSSYGSVKVDLTSSKDFSVAFGTDKSKVAAFEGIVGSMTVSISSIDFLDINISSGTINTGAFSDAVVSGKITGELVIEVGSALKSITFGDLVIQEGASLVIDKGTNTTVTASVKGSAQDSAVLDVPGSIIVENGTLTIDATNTTINTYPTTNLQNVTLDGNVEYVTEETPFEFKGQLSQDQTVSTNQSLTGDLYIPDGLTLTIASGATLNLAGYGIYVQGTLEIQTGGAINNVGKDDGKGFGYGVILLHRDGAIVNDGGVIGSGTPVTVTAKINQKVDGQTGAGYDAYPGFNTDLRVSYPSAGSVELQNVSGVSFDIVNINSTRTLAISGDVYTYGLNTNCTFTLTGAVVDGTLTVGEGVTLGGDFKLQTGATLNVEGTVSGNVTMANNTTVNVEGQVTGKVTAPTGVYKSNGGKATQYTEVSFTTGPAADYVTGVVLTVGQNSYTEDGTSYTEQALYISGNIEAVDFNEDETASAKLIITNKAETAEGAGDATVSYVGADDVLNVDKSVAVDGGNTVVEGQVVYNAESSNKNKVENFNGTAYVIEGAGTADDIGYITTFADAYGQIANAKNGLTIYGDLEIETDVTLASGQKIAIDGSSKVTIGTDYEFVAQKGSSVTGTIYDAQGVLTVYSGANVKAPANYAVYKQTTEYRQWSGLVPAIENAQSGDVIDVQKDATVKNDMSIPAGVTVNVEAGVVLTFQKDLTVEETAVLNNEGTIQMAGEKSAITVNGTLDSSEAGSVVKFVKYDETSKTYKDVTANADGESRSVVSVGTTVMNSTTGVAPFVSAAYYADEDGNTVYTTVAKAVAAVEAQDAGAKTVTVVGTLNEAADVTLAAGTTLNIASKAKVTLGTVTLSAPADGKQAKVEVDGELTATVTGMTGVTGSETAASVELVRAAAGIYMVSATDDANVTSNYMVLDGQIAGAVTVSAGTVNAGALEVSNTTDSRNTLTVASGATLAVADIGTIEAGLTVGTLKDAAAVTVDGTVAFGEGAELDLTDGIMDVNGTMTVSDVDIEVEGTLNIVGTLDVSTVEDEEGSVAVTGILVVGEKPTTLGAGGVLSGAFDTTKGIIKAYAGADLTGALLDVVAGESAAESTAYYVNGDLYMTVYSAGNFDNNAVIGGAYAEDFELVGLVTYDEEKNVDINAITQWYSDAEMSKPVKAASQLGNPEALYFKAAAAEVTITVSVGDGISLYIDDVRQTGNTATLTVGTHTVTATVNPGYSGTVTVQFNGQTVDGTFTITPEMASNAYDGPKAISATGSITQDSVVIDGGNGGSGEMGLTDYLLIILVILIVVMAIIVAMRLMRS